MDARVELGSIARAHGIRLLALDEIDSTNDEARRLIEAGEYGPLWITAARQTKGRGRMGRTWMSPAGNLHASFVFGGIADAVIAPQLGFVAGVAAMRALRAAADVRNVTLKWPNDLLLDDAKLGGVLLESVSVPTGDPRAPRSVVAIIGIGINCAEAPRDLPYPTRSLGSDGPCAAALFAHLSDALTAALDIWRDGAGFPNIREEWLANAFGPGAEIRVALANETVEGRFETIDATGRLVLATRHGPRVIEAGDVLLGPRAAAGALA
jgi:BirA family biotin operon repressor/biotin-[acetyl-CoA-carboxylase] ligase